MGPYLHYAWLRMLTQEVGARFSSLRFWLKEPNTEQRGGETKGGGGERRPYASWEKSCKFAGVPTAAW
jgi:hypothetical protein